jgi:hypothetical protein
MPVPILKSGRPKAVFHTPAAAAFSFHGVPVFSRLTFVGTLFAKSSSSQQSGKNIPEEEEYR